MRVLFDQATPLPIRPYLLGHEIRTAVEEGWETLKNGVLLAAAEAAGFDLLLTSDKSLRYQQDHGNGRSRLRSWVSNNGRDLRPASRSAWNLSVCRAPAPLVNTRCP